MGENTQKDHLFSAASTISHCEWRGSPHQALPSALPAALRRVEAVGVLHLQRLWQIEKGPSPPSAAPFQPEPVRSSVLCGWAVPVASCGCQNLAGRSLSPSWSLRPGPPGVMAVLPSQDTAGPGNQAQARLLEPETWALPGAANMQTELAGGLGLQMCVGPSLARAAGARKQSLKGSCCITSWAGFVMRQNHPLFGRSTPDSGGIR